jgi:diguanylate cyclase (GGDEF)-like protein
MLRQLRWKNLTLTGKMATGFTVMALFTFAALAISFIGLYSLNSTAKKITRHDMVLIRSANRLGDVLHKQGSIVATPGAVQSPQLFAEFHQQEVAFRYILEQIRSDLPPGELAALQARYDSYLKLANRFLAGEAGALAKLKEVSGQLSEDLGQLEMTQQSLVETRVTRADRQENQTVGITLALAAAGFVLAIMVGMLTTFKISRAMGELKKATTRIAEGDFEFDPGIPEGDEIGELAKSFVSMALRLKDLELACLDASPLTRLPGNIAIERALNQKMQLGVPFAFCYTDLDNFKAFNDVYGYVKGSEVIRLTGQLICESVSQCGDQTDFVGHVGGDDFVMIVDCTRVDSICRTIIGRFDAMIVTHYSAAHQAAGCIRGIDRYGAQRVFPLMTISIAVLICGQGRKETALDIALRAAEIKDEVKGLAGSNYLVDAGAGSRRPEPPGAEASPDQATRTDYC